MARNFKELQEKMDARRTPEERTAYKARLAKNIERIRLSQMRNAQEMSQVALAAKLGTDQGSISRIEKQGDMYLSTLRSYVEGLGGRLELLVSLPGQTVVLEIGE